VLDDTGLRGKQLTLHVQVHDAVAFFQHAGVVVPVDCVTFVSTCRQGVQRMQRMDLSRTGATHLSLAKAVEELMKAAANPACVEARDRKSVGVLLFIWLGGCLRLPSSCALLLLLLHRQLACL
jgi:hypothetical protein